jgi:hypothetical protein
MNKFPHQYASRHVWTGERTASSPSWQIYFSPGQEPGKSIRDKELMTLEKFCNLRDLRLLTLFIAFLFSACDFIGIFFF